MTDHHDHDVFAAVHVCSGALVGLPVQARHRVLRALTALLDLASPGPLPPAPSADPSADPVQEEKPPRAAPKVENAKRALILEDLRQHPGAGPRAIAKATGLGDAIVGWHLRRLTADGVVRASGSGNRVTYHLTGNAPAERPRRAKSTSPTSLKAKTETAIVDLLKQHGPKSPKAIWTTVGASRGWVNALLVDLLKRRVLTRTGTPGSPNVRYAVRGQT